MVCFHYSGSIIGPTSPILSRSLPGCLSPPPSRFRTSRHPGARNRTATSASSYHGSGRYPGQLSRTALEIAALSSLYDVLEVSAGASVDEIKAAYRRLARIHHPDVSGRGSSAGDDGDQFMRIHAAYSTLSDPERRAAYDMDLLRRRRCRVRPLGLGFDDGVADPESSSFCRFPRRNWETDQCW